MDIEGNKRVDHLIKKTIRSPKIAFINRYNSFLYISKGLKG
jgi:hypothetical protein